MNKKSFLIFALAFLVANLFVGWISMIWHGGIRDLTPFWEIIVFFDAHIGLIAIPSLLIIWGFSKLDKR